MKKQFAPIFDLQGCVAPPHDPEVACMLTNTQQSKAVQSKIIELSQQLEQGFIEKARYVSTNCPRIRGSVISRTGEAQCNFAPVDGSERRARIKQLETIRSKSEKAEANAAAACFRQGGTELAITAQREGVALTDLVLKWQSEQH